jgi:hypothetical protein
MVMQRVAGFASKSRATSTDAIWTWTDLKQRGKLAGERWDSQSDTCHSGQA